MRKIGLFFGSFNPIHVGHLIIANSMLQHSDLREVWLVVSPQNPLKERRTLLADQQRLEMVRLAVHDNYRLRACDAEFHLPKPSYTVLTLAHLGEQYRDKEFCLIMGSDNLATFDRWRNWEYILDHYQLYVYPRPGSTDCRLASHPHVTMVDVPMMDISSTYIREQIRQGHDVRYLLTEPVWQYLTEMHFYEK
ncbi:MAG: nicotinate-nucleotide adenylyltransferase [Bacteroidales bacterium]|nr:nicotinate-nucleotide adenylyltransferase [Bacteroidales bacterium]